MTKLVNVRHKKCNVMLDRTGPFGNRHLIGWCNICNKVHDRKEAILYYRKDFYKRILTDTEFRDKVVALKDKILGCWCKPLDCHGDVIIEYLETL